MGRFPLLIEHHSENAVVQRTVPVTEHTEASLKIRASSWLLWMRFFNVLLELIFDSLSAQLSLHVLFTLVEGISVALIVLGARIVEHIVGLLLVLGCWLIHGGGITRVRAKVVFQGRCIHDFRFFNALRSSLLIDRIFIDTVVLRHRGLWS